MRTKLFLLLASALALPAGGALGQENLKPETTLRLPPPPNAGSPENKAFIDQALAAASATIEAGRLAAQKAKNGAVRDLAQGIAADQQKLQEDLTKLSQAKGYAPQKLATQQAELAALTRPQGGEADFDRQYLTAQYQADRWQYAVYQTEMAHTQDLQLRDFSAERVLMIRKHLEGVQKAADPLSLRLEVPKSAPQY
jgi:predicted outer membrane protein